MTPFHQMNSVRALRIVAAMFPAILALVLSSPMMQAQVQLGAYSSSQINSNPNRISNQSRGSDDVGDFLGTQAFWAGYDLLLPSGITISPSYSIGLTHWGTASEQNFLQHDFSLFLSYDDLFLLSRAPAMQAIAVDDAALREMAGFNPRKDSLVEWLYDIAGEIADASNAPTTHAAEHETEEATEEPPADDDDWWIDELIGDSVAGTAESDSLRYAVIDDLLANGVEFGFEEEDTVTMERAAAIVADAGVADSLKNAIAESLLDIADSLDMDDGTPYQLAATSWRVRRARSALAATLPDDDLRSRMDTRFDSLLTALSAYGVRDPAMTDENDDVESYNFAPVSLSHRPLIRHTARNYDIETLPSDAGASRLQFYGGAFTGSYISADAELLGYDQYESTVYYGSLLLEQQLGTAWNLWTMVSLSHESYPAQTLFDNMQTEITAQLRYQPSTRLSFVVDGGYGVKSYREDLGESGRKVNDRNIAVDSAASTSLFNLGLGIFFRPVASTLLGVVVARQMTPQLHPRLLLTTAQGRASRRGSSQLADATVTSRSSNISDDNFSWNGSDVQLLVMQSLPWELVATAFYDHNVRNYGQLTATLNGRTTKLDNRTDTRRTLELSVTRDFFPGDGSQMISAGLSFGTVHNASTNFTRRQLPGGDYDYNFSESYGVLRLQWALF